MADASCLRVLYFLTHMYCCGWRSYFTLRSLGILTVTYLVLMILISGIVIPGTLHLFSAVAVPD